MIISYMGYILYRHSGKENGNSFNGLQDCRCISCIGVLYWVYIGIIEKWKRLLRGLGFGV